MLTKEDMTFIAIAIAKANRHSAPYDYVNQVIEAAFPEPEPAPVVEPVIEPVIEPVVEVAEVVTATE